MTRTLFWKFLRDIRWPLVCVGLLLVIYEMLWAKITQRLTDQLLPMFLKLVNPQALMNFQKEVLSGPDGELLQALFGGSFVDFRKPLNTLTIGYVHPFVQTIFGVWAIGRSAGALAGEIDRGTMELLLAQPVSRRQVVLAHLLVDLIAIPFLCLCMLAGTWIGVEAVGMRGVDVHRFWGPLANSAALMFAISGYTLAISAAGRFRWRVVSIAVGITLVMFLVNLLGQLWDVITPLRPLTVFYYFQPQPILFQGNWNVPIGRGLPWLGQGEYYFEVNVIAVLLAVGAAGYLLALRRFCRRDLPAPL